MRHSGPTSPTILKHHPLTGELIEPVGFLPNGKCVWPIMGGAPDDDDDKDDDDASGGDDSKDDDKDDDSNSGGDDDKDVVSKAEFDALKKRMQAADKRASDLEAEKQKADDAKKDDLTKAQDRVTELESSIEELTGTVQTLRLENAFLTANKHKWHDPEIALDLAQRKGYIEDIVDDDGAVDKPALKKALDRLAKEHAYLVMPAKKDKSDDEPDGPSGLPAGGRSDNGKDGSARKQELKNRFPVLNR